MMKHSLNIMIFFALAMLLAVFCISNALAAEGSATMSNLKQTGEYGYGGSEGGSIPFSGSNADLPTIAGKVIGIGLSMIGLMFFLLMLYGGIMWMTSRGNQTTITSAKETIINAIIGIVIVFSAYAITQFIGDILMKN